LFFCFHSCSNFFPPLPPQEKTVAQPTAPATTNNSNSDGHSLASLVRKKSTGDLDSGMDPMNLEIHLNDGGFQELFNMDKKTFAAMPKWKRDREKKKHGLF